MATIDAKSGFRLPWSSEKPSANPDPTEAETAGAEGETPWPVTDTAEGASAPAEPAAGAAAHHEPPSEGTVSAPISPAAPARKAPAKPTKFLADLTKAMQAAAEAAREQTLTQFQADAKTFVELIHERSAGESTTLKAQADADIDGIRSWSKAEIARIREETEAKIQARKVELDAEVEEHAARIERQIEQVHGSVGSFEREMATFFEELLEETDPARFAAMAESLPEPPSFEDILPEAFEVDAPRAVSVAAPIHETDGTGGSTEADEVDARASETVDDTAATPAPEPLVGEEPAGEPVDRESVMAPAEGTVVAEIAAEPASEAEASAGVAVTAAELPDGAETAGSWPSADFDTAEAEAALAARMDAPDAGLEAKSVAFADRLASLAMPMPASGDAAGNEMHSTQVVVVGLVSVASIAGFKRHIGRLPGVQAVGVSSGPDGEFVFTVSHLGDVDFRDAVPSLPGFGARVTATGEGVVNVTARDPETEA